MSKVSDQNCVIQYSPDSNPFMVHIDNLKPCYLKEIPERWQQQQQPPEEGSHSNDSSSSDDSDDSDNPHSEEEGQVSSTDSAEESLLGRGKRIRKPRNILDL